MIAQPTISAPILDSQATWEACRFLTCSVLPVRVACNLKCPFCFSKSSISSLQRDQPDWQSIDVEGYYQHAIDRGANRLVITGGGEPLLRPDDVLYLVAVGGKYFDEIACFTNGTYLSSGLAGQLVDAGLSYVCYSRHHQCDEVAGQLMGPGTPRLEEFFTAAAGLKVRATCVMARGYVDSVAKVHDYIDELGSYGVREFTFKHTYVAYEDSVFGASHQNRWAGDHQVEFDPFAQHGSVIAQLPWGPKIRRFGPYQVCYYHEPTPAWEKENQLCRSINLLSDGTVYASLEDASSQLSRPADC
ncbi:MAG: radical SAM protein [Planctomycetales bacterium]